ncbi:MAG: hypothetical protein SWE60_17820 [Thermodesulfobacteriota bacterium]|nr:hypothetical protein [Thermodesulfobacteriota bacterium]
MKKDLEGLLEGLKAVIGQVDSLIERYDQLARTEKAKSKLKGSAR